MHTAVLSMRFDFLLLRPMRLTIEAGRCIGHSAGKVSWHDAPRAARELGPAMQHRIGSGTDRELRPWQSKARTPLVLFEFEARRL